ncbi:hypothetical protein A0J51_02530 [Gluconobacter japonicus]|nr:hypothetical protein A0J51_02530 [Gluconobacter japonicus]
MIDSDALRDLIFQVIPGSYGSNNAVLAQDQTIWLVCDSLNGINCEGVCVEGQERAANGSMISHGASPIAQHFRSGNDCAKAERFC